MVILYRADRITSDIDLLIESDQENGKRVIKTFMDNGLEIEDLVPEDFETDPSLSFGFEPEAVDRMKFTKGITFDDACKNASVVTLDD